MDLGTEDWQDITSEFFEALKDLELGELTRGERWKRPKIKFPKIFFLRFSRPGSLRGDDCSGDDGPEDGRGYAVQQEQNTAADL